MDFWIKQLPPHLLKDFLTSLIANNVIFMSGRESINGQYMVSGRGVLLDAYFSALGSTCCGNITFQYDRLYRRLSGPRYPVSFNELPETFTANYETEYGVTLDIGLMMSPYFNCIISCEVSLSNDLKFKRIEEITIMPDAYCNLDYKELEELFMMALIQKG